MIKLIHAELIKVLKRKYIFVIAIIIILLTLANVALTKSDFNNSNWKNAALNEYNKLLEIQDNNRNKMSEISNETDLKVLEIDMRATQERIEILEYAIDENIPIGVPSIIRFVNDNFLLSYLIVLLIIVLAAHTMQDEYVFGTIRQIFIQTSNRWKIICSKYFSLLIISFVGILLLLIVSFLFAAIFLNYSGGEIELKYIDGIIVQQNIYVVLLKRILAVLALIATEVAIMILLSCIFSKGFIPILVGIGIWIGNNTIYNMISSLPGSRFSIFANIDLTQYIEGENNLMTGNSIAISLGILIIHIVLCLIISKIILNKKEVY